MAVVAGVESAVRIHIDRGDDLNARDDKCQTPLMLSAARNKASICKLLLDAGADADLLDPVRRSALSIAQAAGAIEAAAAIEAACMPQTHQGDVFHEPALISPDAHRAQAANDSPADHQIDAGPAQPAEQPAAVLEQAPATAPAIDWDLFGLGVAVRRGNGESATAGAAGDYYWGGAGGTYMWVDPKNDMFVVFMMQSPKQRVHYRALLRDMVYAAVLK